MQLERKQYSATVSTPDADAGVVEAIVSVFGNIDHANEVVLPGAFKTSLQTRLPKGVWAHQWDMPIAKTLEARETDKGLYIKGQFNLDTQRGREAYSDIKFGIIDEFSIGYRVKLDQVNEETKARELVDIELYEWSPVLVGMNDQTELLTIKSGVPATLAAEAAAVLAYSQKLLVRTESVVKLRAKDNRTIGAESRDNITACIDVTRKLQLVADGLEAALAQKKVDLGEARKLYADYLHMVTAMHRR